MSRLLLLALAVCLSATAIAQTPSNTADNSVAELLKKMSEKPRQINYEGIFTYQHKDNPGLQTFRILHWHSDGVSHDRLQHLNGPEREISRDGLLNDCESIGDRLRQGKMPVLGDLVAQMKDYHFELRNKERIAGRIATVLLAVPKDQFRYSYFFSIDDETGLILKVWLVDEKAHPLERYQFMEVNLNPDISKLAQEPVRGIHKDLPDKSNCVEQTESSRWQLSWLPSGFLFSGQGQPKPNLDMLMFTDGLATFSVFIEPTTAPIPEGFAQRGATLAMMTGLQHQGQIYRVTVVGEIPAITAQRIAQGLVAK